MLPFRARSHLRVRKGLHAHRARAVQGPCSDLLCGYGISLGVRKGKDEPAFALVSRRESPIYKGNEDVRHEHGLSCASLAKEDHLLARSLFGGNLRPVFFPSLLHHVREGRTSQNLHPCKSNLGSVFAR